MLCRLLLTVACCALWSLPLTAQEAAKKAAEPAVEAPKPEELIKKLAEDLTNVKLIGRFTVTGKEDREPKQEEYTITSALKLPEGDMWLLKSRIKYGDKDVTVPIPLEIKWAGDTPMITLTNLTIPNLGTFSSRVLIYEGRYAGTWQHGNIGGHMYGRLEKASPETPPVK